MLTFGGVHVGCGFALQPHRPTCRSRLCWAPSLEILCGGAGLMILSSFTGQWGQLHLAAISARSLAAWLTWWSSGLADRIWRLHLVYYAWRPTSLVSTYAYVNPLVAIFVGNLLAADAGQPGI